MWNKLHILGNPASSVLFACFNLSYSTFIYSRTILYIEALQTLFLPEGDSSMQWYIFDTDIWHNWHILLNNCKWNFSKFIINRYIPILFFFFYFVTLVRLLTHNIDCVSLKLSLTRQSKGVVLSIRSRIMLFHKQLCIWKITCELVLVFRSSYDL